MYTLSRISISNFRSCQQVDFALAAFTPFVGYNNAGKSNLLAAIRWFIAPFALEAADFNQLSLPVVVEGEINGITASLLDRLDVKHRSRIEPLLMDGGLLRFRRELSSPGAASTAVLSIWNVSAGDSGEWVINPTGIAAALKALFPEPVVIGAMEDAAEDSSKVKSSNTIGKLLAEFSVALEDAHSGQLATVLADLRSSFNANGGSRSVTLQRFDEEATSVLRDYFPGVALHLEIPVPEMGALLKGATVKVSEAGGEARDFSCLGHGAQRSIQMSMIQYLAEVRERAVGSGSEPGQRLLIIDEPELFLHPQAIEQVREALKRLSRNGCQVLFTTHSPLMIDRESVPNTRLVRKGSSTTVASTLETVLQRYVNDDGSRLQTLLDLKNAKEWLFADRALLVEGITETRVLPVLVQAVTGKSLGSRSVALVQVDGGAAVSDCMNVLGAMGMTCFAIADLDYVLDKAPSSGMIAKDDPLLLRMLEEFRQLAEQDERVRLDNGRPCRDKERKDSLKPSAAVTLWATTVGRDTADAMRGALRSQEVWLWPSGDIEHHLGLPGKKGPAQAKFVNDIEDRGWRAVVSDIEAVEELASWLEAVCA
ncbi:ATP-dependent nuclease [Pelodictyon luteolum]|uniref:ATP-dependent endonuclease of the OLD family-like protein n=1 Tax=Chlorobium luteolum (strain DSM 273 / BCRC 81028 / 2530) TaxID=319225 RepID=Q3B1R7_CHLL3|nr:AAA family ATPase [Pelodictyon luteolum]ABB24714.1 ATP-dependent endonuclease of the OLD family-like protein [Pelodictyon luteolum DSM 273]